ncbi:MAG TPA: hypothetical protein VF678_13555 [bacterium]
MAAATELRPNLALVPTRSVRFHEDPERRRTLRLMDRIKAEALLRNPPIVADMGDGHYLLLDGANRVSAFAELGYSHTPVQVADYGHESIQLKSWHHLILNGRALDLRKIYAALDGVELRQVPPEQLDQLLTFRRVYAVWVDATTACWGLFPKSDGPIDVHQRNGVLHKIVKGYEGQSQLERIKLADYTKLSDAIRSVDHQLVLFPVLTKEELLRLAAEGVMIPTGISRHLIPGRALMINLALGFLTELMDDAAKLAHFTAYVNRLEMEGRIRFYEESVFIMNE